MKPILILVAFLFSFKCGLGEFVTKTLGDSVNLTATEDCGADFKLTCVQKDEGKGTHKITIVGIRVGGVWKAVEDYKNRSEHRSDLGVTLTRLNYNDNGLYEFSCGKDLINVIDLEVVKSSEVVVPEGGSVTLPCHSVTVGAPARIQRWEKDGKLLVEFDLSSGNVTNPGKVSVSPSWRSEGDLSLTVRGAELKDQGRYFNFVCDKGGKKLGGTTAVALTVSRNQTLPLTQKTCGRMETCWIISIVLGVIIMVIVVGVAVFYWCNKPRASSASGGRRQTEVEMGLISKALGVLK